MLYAPSNLCQNLIYINYTIYSLNKMLLQILQVSAFVRALHILKKF